VNFYKHHIGDYQKKTAQLSLAEHGAYLLMLQHYYGTEKPLPIGRALHRLLRAHTKLERDAINSIARQFWQHTDQGLVNGRAIAEIAEANEGDARRKGERERQARYRERRRVIYDELQKRGITPPFDASTEELMALLSPKQRDSHVTQDVTQDVTVMRDITREVTAKTPDSRLQTPEKEEAKDSPATAGVCSPKNGEHRLPACPIAEIIALYHAELPALPRMEVRNKTRDQHIAARWRQVFADGKAHDKAEGLALFRNFFEFTREAKFLTGQTNSRDKDRPPFVANLDWLMRPTNFANTVEGKYHR